MLENHKYAKWKGLLCQKAWRSRVPNKFEQIWMNEVISRSRWLITREYVWIKRTITFRTFKFVMLINESGYFSAFDDTSLWLLAIAPNWKCHATLMKDSWNIRRFSNYVGEGSRNIPKMNSLYFFHKKISIYSNLLKLENVGEFSWSWRKIRLVCLNNVA